MQFLKADTSVKVVIGPAVDIADGITPVTTLAVSSADEAEIMKHDAASVTDISGRTFAAITSADGYYNLTLTAGDVDTEGMLTVLINDDSLVLPIRQDFMVVNANVFDSLFAAAGTDYLQADAVQISSATTAADNLELEYVGTGYKSYVRRATAQAGGASTITLDASASATTSLYNGMLVTIISGTGAGQTRIITAYNGGTKQATVVPAWTTNPASGSVFVLTPGHANVAAFRLSQPNTLVSGRVDSSVGAMASAVLTATAIATDAITNAKLAADAIGASELAADAAAEIATAVWAATTRALTEIATANVTQINSSASAAAQLALSANAIESGAAEGSPTTTVIQTDLAETQDDIYIGRTIIFTSGAARGEASAISDYVGSTGTITVSPALANAPSAADTFLIV
jgi:hypothetical protein